jgi:hypothetical protein
MIQRDEHVIREMLFMKSCERTNIEIGIPPILIVNKKKRTYILKEDRKLERVALWIIMRRLNYRRRF